MITLLSSTASAQVVSQISGLAVFDANGTRVGPVVGLTREGNTVAPPNVWFSFDTNNVLVTLHVGLGGHDLLGLAGREWGQGQKMGSGMSIDLLNRPRRKRGEAAIAAAMT